MLFLLIGCAPADFPDAKLETFPWVEREPLGACESFDACRSDEFCYEGGCLPHTARSFGFDFIAASVGKVRPDGGAWETSAFATSVEPDLLAKVYWSEGSVEEEDRASCGTSEVVDTYYASWTDPVCWFSVTPDPDSMGLGPALFEENAVLINLWDVDSFDMDFIAGWSWDEAQEIEDLAALDGERVRLEMGAQPGGTALWLDVDVWVEVNP